MSWMAELCWMEQALEQAQIAFDQQEVPVGAVIVQHTAEGRGRLVCAAYNRVESARDGSCHAELLCLREAAQLLGRWRLYDCTLYCTLEPCVMCYGAMVHFRLGRLVWGAADLRHGALGSFYDLSQRRHPIHSIEWRGFFMQEPCQEILRRFFRQRREEASRGGSAAAEPQLGVSDHKLVEIGQDKLCEP